MSKVNKNAEEFKGTTNVPLFVGTTVSTAPPAAKNKGRLIFLTAGGTSSVPCVAISDGTNWKQIAVGANAI